MAGRKISRANMARIQAIADHAHAMGARHPGMADTTPIGKADSLGDTIEAVSRAVMMISGMDGYCCVEDVYDTYAIIEQCANGVETYWRADYSMSADGAVTLAGRDSWRRVVEAWIDAPDTPAAKAGAMLSESSATHYASMKALGDRLLEVKVAYYGHKNGKDSHNEFFSPNTDFAPDDFPAPPLLYYHGYTEDNRKSAKPIVTGKFVSRRTGSDGHYLTYKLKSGKYADKQYDAALKGECVVSPGTIGHLIRKDASGELLYWPLAEVSAWDYAANREPANLHSVAAPVLKALYLAEGLNLPTSLIAPETAGDAVTSGADTQITTEQKRQIIAYLTLDLLRTYRKETSN
jgi:hypothetical protein